MNLQDQIKQAVELSAECLVALVETFRRQIVWKCNVAVFDLKGHPKAKRGCGRAYRDCAETRFVAVLEISCVDSASTAVRLAIAKKTQK